MPIAIDFFEDSDEHVSHLTKAPEDKMTKTRHRIFEIFDSAEEARGALATKSAILQTNTGDPQSWSLRQLAASQSAGIVHVKFKKAEVSSADTVREFSSDLSEFAGSLANGSRVLLDLEGLREFGAEPIAELENFGQKLRAKGSRFVLCNLNQLVEASFFPSRSQ